MDQNIDHQKSLSKSKCWHSNNCLHFLKVCCSIHLRAVRLYSNSLSSSSQNEHQQQSQNHFRWRREKKSCQRIPTVDGKRQFPDWNTPNRRVEESQRHLRRLIRVEHFQPFFSNRVFSRNRKFRIKLSKIKDLAGGGGLVGRALDCQMELFQRGVQIWEMAWGEKLWGNQKNKYRLAVGQVEASVQVVS